MEIGVERDRVEWISGCRMRVIGIRLTGAQSPMTPKFWAGP